MPVIALAPNAPQPTSPLDLSPAPANSDASKNSGEQFHSMLREASDADEQPKPKSPKKAKDKSAANALPIAIPVTPQQQPAKPPITLNLLPVAGPPAKAEDGQTDPGAPSIDPQMGRKIAEPSLQPRVAMLTESRVRREPQLTARPEIDPELSTKVAAKASDTLLSKAELSFEAHLRPAAPTATSAVAATTPASPLKPEIARPGIENSSTEPANSTAPEATSAPSQAASSNSKHGDSSHHQNQDHEDDNPSASISQAQTASGSAAPQTRFDINPVAAPAAPPTPAAHPVNRPEAPVPAAPVQAPEAPQAPVSHAANDIKLELNGGGERVEVRLTERDGDIHVAVRSVDARLSDAMRADLPALTAKLEKSGFHADAWQPGAAPSGERRSLETAAGNQSQDSQDRSGRNSQQQQQEDSQQQNPKHPNHAGNRKSDRKDFEWLLQTYR